jgi:RNA polymerase sigma factor (sigma-70 family)
VDLLWPTDARLIARVRAGDSRAYETLYRRYSPAILAFCRQLTGQREDAEDALQHTFLAAYRQIVDSQAPLELRPWLFTVARNRCLAQLRARGTQARLQPDPMDREIAALTDEVERREALRNLVADLQMLPEPQRAALLLSQLDAMPYEEIGQVLDVPAEKVKSLVFQARTSLASTQEAREAPCVDIRTQLATARGASLRRRSLRRHVGLCSGCREYETIVRGQRRDLDVLLPVLPSAAITGAVMEAISREAGVGVGAGAAATAAGGTVGGSFAGSLGAFGGSAIIKVAAVAVVVGGGGAGAVAADLPQRIAPEPQQQVVAPESGPGARSGGETYGHPIGGGQTLDRDGNRPSESGPKSGDRPARAETGQAEGSESGQSSDEPVSDGDGEGGGDDSSGSHIGKAPPGLADKGGFPPGQAKKQAGSKGPPPGKEKQKAAPPGNGNGGGNGNNGGGNGNGVGNGQGNGGGNGGGTGGQGNGGGGNGQGNGGAGGGTGGQGGGGDGGNGNGNGNGGGNGQGNGGGNGNGG